MTETATESEATETPEEASAPVEAGAEESSEDSTPAPVFVGDSAYGTGRRKTAAARVYLTAGSGEWVINGRTLDDFFPNDVLKLIVRQPFMLSETEGSVDVRATVKGGGSAGQAGAIRHGISRALIQMNPDFREGLKAAGLLTRDPRKKERKKYGQKGARARFQFSKR